MNFNRRSPEEFQWKIFLGEDLLALAVLAVLCHFDGKLFVIHPTNGKHCFPDGQVYVAWKHKMLLDVIGGHQGR